MHNDMASYNHIVIVAIIMTIWVGMIDGNLRADEITDKRVFVIDHRVDLREEAYNMRHFHQMKH